MIIVRIRKTRKKGQQGRSTSKNWETHKLPTTAHLQRFLREYDTKFRQKEYQIVEILFNK